MNYSVSVIVPVYNCESYLERAIKSVINQSLFNECELILVDDGSTDNSPEICDSYSTEYDNIKVLHQSNSGVSVARNNGIEIAEGEWICFLDSDDYLLDGALNLINNFPDVDLICSSHKSNEIIPADYMKHLPFGTYNVDDIRESLVNSLATCQYFYPCWAKFFKRSLIVENSICFPVGRKLAEDMVFVYTYLSKCKTITLTDKTIYYYYVNSDNTTNVVAKSFETFKFIHKWKTEYFTAHGWFDETVKKCLIESFVWNCFLSFKSKATYASFFDAVRCLKKYFNDDEFYKLYLITDYRVFKTLTDRILDWSIRNNNPIPFCLFVRLITTKSKLIRKFTR